MPLVLEDFFANFVNWSLGQNSYNHQSPLSTIFCKLSFQTTCKSFWLLFHTNWMQMIVLDFLWVLQVVFPDFFRKFSKLLYQDTPEIFSFCCDRDQSIFVFFIWYQYFWPLKSPFFRDLFLDSLFLKVFLMTFSEGFFLMNYS